MKQTAELKRFYAEKAAEHRREAAYCTGKHWNHLAAVQDKLAAEWLAKIKT